MQLYIFYIYLKNGGNGILRILRFSFVLTFIFVTCYVRFSS